MTVLTMSGCGKNACCITFIKSTREIMVAGACRGIWKMKAAPADSKNKT